MSIPAGPGSEAVDSFAQLETIGEVVFPLERASHSGAAHHDRMFMWAHALLAAADERQRPPGTVAGEFKNALTRLTPATAMYVTTDDLLAAHPEPVPPRPRVAIAPKITDADLLTVAVMQALLGYTSEARWLRYCPDEPGHHGRAPAPATGRQQAAAQTRRFDALADGGAGPASIGRRR